MSITFYWKSTCSSCRDARKIVRELSLDAVEREYGTKKPLSEEEVLGIVKAAGSVAAVLNARHEIAKEKGWKSTPPDAATFAKAVTEESNLIRRPILLLGKGKAARAVVGLDEEAYRKVSDDAAED
jgi:arsenate reductase-like glutaredoxin family protein